MRYIFSFITILATIGCGAPRYKHIEYKEQKVVDLMFFSTQRKISDSVYSIDLEYLNAHQFLLKHEGQVFFKGDNLRNEYLFEGFQKKYFFITPLPAGHQLSSPFLAKRDSVFLYDLHGKKLYNFNAKDYMILAFRSSPARMATEQIAKMKSNGNTVTATYDRVDIGKGELQLLLGDEITRETIKLELVSDF